MLITWKRVAETKSETLALAYVEGTISCFGLEDERRKVKVPGKTRIPAGVYKVLVRNEGGMNARYKAKFPEMHKGMLHLQDVPNFTWIYIHMGNTNLNTEGCLLVAEQARIDSSRDITVPNSQPAYERLYEQVVQDAIAGTLWINIIDNETT